MSDLVERLRARLVTVPKPGTKPFAPTGSVPMVIGGGPYKPGDDAGLQGVHDYTAPRGMTQPWRVQAHVYAGEPLAYEAADELERLRKALREVDTFMDDAPTVRSIIRAALDGGGK